MKYSTCSIRLCLDSLSVRSVVLRERIKSQEEKKSIKIQTFTFDFAARFNCNSIATHWGRSELIKRTKEKKALGDLKAASLYQKHINSLCKSPHLQIFFSSCRQATVWISESEWVGGEKETDRLSLTATRIGIAVNSELTSIKPTSNFVDNNNNNEGDDKQINKSPPEKKQFQNREETWLKISTSRLYWRHHTT